MNAIRGILLPGWATGRECWTELLHGLGGLINGHHVDWSAATTADDHVALALEVMKGQSGNKVVLLGWSLGAMVAMQVATRFKDAVAGLVLVAPCARFIRDDQQPHPGWDARVLTRMKRRMAQAPAEVLKDFSRLMLSEGEQAHDWSTERMNSLLTARAPVASLQAGLDYLVSTDLRGLLELREVPTWIIHGSDDQVCPPVASEALVQRQLVTAERWVVQGAGHAPHVTRAHECAPWLKTRLETLHATG